VSSPTTRREAGASGAATTPDDVPSYVAAVRARLDDLAPDEVEELTGGLEADLTEALAGFDETPRERFGDPGAYADELRAAADLPPRRDPQPAGLGAVLDGARRRWVATGDAQLEALRRVPGFATVRDFVVILRPVWWVLRAWVAVAALRQLFAGERGLVGSIPSAVLLLVAVVVSVALGRRTPLRRTQARVLLAVGNVLAVLALPFVVANLAPSYANPASVEYGAPAGLWLNGEPVVDIRPYDAQGRPLTDVQLYDDQGQPLEIGDEYRWSDTGVPKPANVFPQHPPTPDVTESPGAVPTEDAPEPSASMEPTEPTEPTTEPTEDPTPEPAAEVTDEPTEAPTAAPSP
jgi:hypothetical protein